MCVKTVLTLAITERGRNSIVHQCRCSNHYLYSYGYSNSYWCGRPVKFGLNRIKVCGVSAFWDFYNQLFCIHPSDSWLFSCSSVCLVTIVICVSVCLSAPQMKSRLFFPFQWFLGQPRPRVGFCQCIHVWFNNATSSSSLSSQSICGQGTWVSLFAFTYSQTLPEDKDVLIQKYTIKGIIK